MEPVDVLRQALAAVEGADIPEDLRPLAFTTAVDLVVTGRATTGGSGRSSRGDAHRGDTASGASSPAVVPAPAHRPPAPSGPPAPSAPAAPSWSTAAAGVAPAPSVPTARTLPSAVAPGPAPGAGAGGWDAVAAELGVRPALLDRLWDEHAGQLRLIGDVERFGRTRAERVGNAALLLLAGLRWSGRDAGAPVPDAVVRAEIDRLGLLDTGNYTKHLASRRSLLSTTGSGRTATYKLRYDGAEEARRLARALLEEA